ncbi:hypothetical protein JQS43_11665 [Natronosporangium hydrolyticum]|uniref:DUF1998 domain-containing protein n=1 Tax=Natronosporangium hydrolyticum TaxID=2811111 RepID=A0A895YLN2_9ACTN|nr:hypothetical protein [Natronosporangium hydrolyticum]QSB16875.1 hypothetical protein JQS43_11665 [Natronosporangium hydrolyticum]
MAKIGSRSGSQILRTFLPDQTVDLNGNIYRVAEWSAPSHVEVDTDLVRRRLLQEVGAWVVHGTDGGVGDELARGAPVEVVALDEQRGVLVERYPQVWLCRSCKRIGKSADRRCVCGQRHWGQLHFVGVHSCGAIAEPWVKRCPDHDDVKVVTPKSAKAADITFVCPVCNRQTMQGLGRGHRCRCGDGTVRWNVHKARTVYTPRSTVMINPPQPEHREALKLAGGARKALMWVVEGLTAPRPADVTAKQTKEELTAQLVAGGIDPAIAEQMASTAEVGGQLATPGDHPLDQLRADRREEAEQEAVDIAMALAESRQPTTDLRGGTPGDALDQRYRTDYPAALSRAGVDGIDLVDQFPVLNAVYGYTRGDDDPSKCRLVPFRHKGGYRLYGNLARTEAFLVRLDPTRVATWLTGRGHTLPEWTRGADDPVAARVAILQSAVIPSKRDDPSVESIGTDVVKLVHTYAHRFIRQAAVFSGIERDALSEYLVPGQLAFFVYAAARGDFVLGGMQAVFESNLDDLLSAFFDAEHRCPLDPGCSYGSGACSACLHLGEPSCRFFNRFLDRQVLFGRDGYLRTRR